ncbi:hypothetical protein GHT06_013663 [Daphnia sinensis]|uniref:Uncharacterized protein n=1 Tax=Daphnia sinensis TaxID=1820382 RepID=A0AAD5LCF1_9CRUS|nr:hypothetical protein GHT06_013663 [Daphnia sinensis]
MKSLFRKVEDFVKRKFSKVVHVANGSHEAVRVTVKDNGENQQETCAALERGEITQHRSTGWTNDPKITVYVHVEYKNGHVESMNTRNNKSVIITDDGLVKAKYETWYQGNDSSVWRDQNDNCYKPSCNNKGFFFSFLADNPLKL